MLNRIRKSRKSWVVILIGAMCVTNIVHANSRVARNVDVVIALDVSGSMSGLIDSAKQRLWEIVKELGRAQPQPELRLAILSFGRPSYGVDTGYVRIDLPFTTDLDAVNETLFAFGTDGGEEYVARVVTASVRELEWSRDPDALKILFVAGNEAATQDPQISIAAATQAAGNEGIIVNAIYCGSDDDSDAAGWRDVAIWTDGLYASIDQNRAAVANISTPMDRELAELNQALNETYLVYGDAGQRRKENQLEQDNNAAAMSSSTMAGRVVAKASALYDSAAWDLVDAMAAGTPLEEIATGQLPDEMRAMSVDRRREYIDDRAKKRQRLRTRISRLAEERQKYIDEQRSSRRRARNKGLDEVMQAGVRAIAEKKGFAFESVSSD